MARESMRSRPQHESTTFRQTLLRNSGGTARRGPTLIAQGRSEIAGRFRRSLLMLAVGAALVAVSPAAQTQRWAPAGHLTVPRAGHTVTPLAGGRLLIAGGENAAGLVAAAEIFDLSAGTSQTIGPLIVPRQQHTATRLTDGRVLLAGGVGANGLVAAAELFDPATETFTAAAAMNQPRVRHTATVLTPNWILFAGGNGGAGATNALELFNVARHAFQPLPVTLLEAREQHSATLNADGTVLFAGGSSGEAPLSSTEVLIPEDWSLAPGPALQQARYAHTAALTLFGDLMIAGGTDGSSALTSVETLTHDDGAFAVSAALQVGRFGHQAIVLPQSGNVLLAGGSREDGPASEAELFELNGQEMVSAGALALARTAAAVAANGGRACVLGGRGWSGEFLASVECSSYPTIATDEPDYAPNSVVTFSGRGWLPGETVDITLSVVGREGTTSVFAMADEQGRLLNTDFMTRDVDLGAVFHVRAVGTISNQTAFMSFTDSHETSDPCGPFSVVALCSVRPDHIDTSSPMEISLEAHGVGTFNAFDVTIVNPDNPFLRRTFRNIPKDGNFLTFTLPAVDALGGPLLDVFYTARLVVQVPTSVHCHKKILGVCIAPHIHTSPVTTATVNSNALQIEVFRQPPAPGETDPSDLTPPLITPTVSGTLGENGWYVSDVHVSWTVDDQESGFSASGCDAATVTADTAGTTYTCSASSAGGTSSESVTIKRDATRPSIVFGAPSPAANAAGWHNTDVSVPFTASDNLSGLADPLPPTPLVLDVEGTGVDGEVSVSDLAGNVATVSSPAVNIDRTAPVITGMPDRGPDVNGWYNHAVLIAWSCRDSLSGVGSCSPASAYAGPDAASASVSGMATDQAGNTASSQVGFRYDATGPMIAVTSPADGAVFLLDQVVAASYACADDLSGLTACAGPVGSGAQVATAAVGSHAFVVNATDAAGNTTARTHRYDVHYAFDGFFAPVSNLPLINSAKAGRTIPLKWVLKNAQGAIVSTLASFGALVSFAVPCDASPVSIVEEEALPTGGTVLRFESGQFIYNWQTSSAWSGCRVLQLTLADGSQQRLKFEFR